MIPLVTFLVAAVILLAYEWYSLATHRVPTITALVRGVFRAYPWIAGSTTIGLAVLWLHFLTDWP